MPKRTNLASIEKMFRSLVVAENQFAKLETKQEHLESRRGRGGKMAVLSELEELERLPGAIQAAEDAAGDRKAQLMAALAEELERATPIIAGIESKLIARVSRLLLPFSSNANEAREAARRLSGVNQWNFAAREIADAIRREEYQKAVELLSEVYATAK